MLTMKLDAPRSGNRSLRTGRVSLPSHVYHVTTRTLPGTAPFRDGCTALVACESMVAAAARTDARLLCWVLMPDHAHWLIEIGQLDSLSTVVARLKSASAGACNLRKSWAVGNKIWQTGFFDRAIRSDEDIVQVARYIVANPLRAGLARRIGDYAWWDSIWL